MFHIEVGQAHINVGRHTARTCAIAIATTDALNHTPNFVDASVTHEHMTLWYKREPDEFDDGFIDFSNYRHVIVNWPPKISDWLHNYDKLEEKREYEVKPFSFDIDTSDSIGFVVSTEGI